MRVLMQCLYNIILHRPILVHPDFIKFLFPVLIDDLPVLFDQNQIQRINLECIRLQRIGLLSETNCTTKEKCENKSELLHLESLPISLITIGGYRG